MDIGVLDHYLRFIHYSSHLPVFLYQGDTISYYHSAEIEDAAPERWKGTSFDPQILLTKESIVGYETSHNLIAAGWVKEKSGNLAVLIGPVPLGALSDVTMQQMIHEETVPLTQLQSIFQYLRKYKPVAMEMLFWYISAVHMTMNQEIWNPREGLMSTTLLEATAERSDTYREEQDAFALVSPRLAYDYETELLHYLEEGETQNLMSWWNYANRAGRSASHLHGQTESMQNWNRFVTSASVISRAAMRGGLPPEIAMPLFDYYVDLADREHSYNTLDDITAKMLYDFCERVRKTKQVKAGSALVNRAARYIVEHIDSPLTVQEVAEHTGVTPEYLTKCFKQDFGTTVSAYIRNWRIHRAKRLLTFSDRSLSEIAAYLAFSSQSHFQTVFKKEMGITPQEYRKQSRD